MINSVTDLAAEFRCDATGVGGVHLLRPNLLRLAAGVRQQGPRGLHATAAIRKPLVPPPPKQSLVGHVVQNFKSGFENSSFEQQQRGDFRLHSMNGGFAKRLYGEIKTFTARLQGAQLAAAAAFKERLLYSDDSPLSAHDRQVLSNSAVAYAGWQIAEYFLKKACFSIAAFEFLTNINVDVVVNQMWLKLMALFSLLGGFITYVMGLIGGDFITESKIVKLVDQMEKLEEAISALQEDIDLVDAQKRDFVKRGVSDYIELKYPKVYAEHLVHQNYPEKYVAEANEYLTSAVFDDSVTTLIFRIFGDVDFDFFESTTPTDLLVEMHRRVTVLRGIDNVASQVRKQIEARNLWFTDESYFNDADQRVWSSRQQELVEKGARLKAINDELDLVLRKHRDAADLAFGNY